jgi:hypothetical protein
MSIALFKITDCFYLSKVGLVLLPGLGDKAVPIGTPITIVRPDSSEIETKVISIFFDSSYPITIEKSIQKEDVPIGSEVYAKKSLTYDLSYFNFLSQGHNGKDYEITFEHKAFKNFATKLKLLNISLIDDNLQDKTAVARLRINMAPGKDSGELVKREKTSEMGRYPEVQIFIDNDCRTICFRGVAKEIEFRGLHIT